MPRVLVMGEPVHVKLIEVRVCTCSQVTMAVGRAYNWCIGTVGESPKQEIHHG